MKAEQKYPVTTDYGVAKLALIGLLGFFVGCIILFYDSMFNQKSSSFHELQYNPRVNAQQIVGKYNSELEGAIKKRKELTDSLRGEQKKAGQQKTGNIASSKTKKTDSLAAAIAKIDSLNNLDNSKRDALKKYIGFYTNGLADVDSLSFKELNKVLHFKISPDTVERWGCLFDSIRQDSLGPVYFSFKDPQANLRDSIAGTTYFKIKRATSNLAFIVRYPSAGTWVLLILVLCSFCFIAIITCFSLRDKAHAIFDNANYLRAGRGEYWKISVITAFCIALFIGSWGLSFYDAEIVKNLFFKQHLMTSVYCVLTLGCIAGAFCLAGFIYTASMLSFFATDLKEKAETIYRKKGENAVENLADTATMQKANTELTEMETQQAELQNLYKRLVAVFRSYFIIAAILLSLTVLCTGALFNTINSLDFLRLLSDDWGYSPLRGDFVYFYGALFTIILLLVYVPARIKFTETNRWEGGAVLPEPANGQGRLMDILKSPFSQLKDMLVVASPLLASLVQSLLETLFK